MAPEFLVEYRPDVVIVMSPIYLPEIKARLESLDVRPQCLITVEAAEPLEPYVRAIERRQPSRKSSAHS